MQARPGFFTNRSRNDWRAAGCSLSANYKLFLHLRTFFAPTSAGIFEFGSQLAKDRHERTRTAGLRGAKLQPAAPCGRNPSFKIRCNCRPLRGAACGARMFGDELRASAVGGCGPHGPNGPIPTPDKPRSRAEGPAPQRSISPPGAAAGCGALEGANEK